MIEDIASFVVAILGIGLAVLFQMIKEGQFRRNSYDIQHSITLSSAEFCRGTPAPSFVVPCDSGPYPLLAFSILFLDCRLKSRAIVACGTDVMLLARASGEARITDVVSCHKLEDLRILRLGGLYGKVELGMERLWIERKYFNDVKAINRLPGSER